MLIEDIPRSDCIGILSRTRLGRLACAQREQPYITPLFFAYDCDALYALSTLGQKIVWMRTNPLVCVEADEVTSPQQWSSVIVFGRYEELPAESEDDSARKLAYSLLQQRPVWWEPAYAKTVREGNERPLELVYFRIHVVQISGHRTKISSL
jgi:nitroimidazol reductase NimA-like FMN-containing flavoprotein (pyridoxamine 5'-phosphate oxidase superfamily)